MSLQVWMPLLGNLNNYGLMPGDITGTVFTEAQNGKIGKCVKATGRLDTPIDGNIINTSSLSFGGWFKFNKDEIAAVLNGHSRITSSATTPTGSLIGNDSYGGIGIVWSSNNMYSTGEFTAMSVMCALRTPTGSRTTTSKTIDFDTWTHIFMTYDKTLNKLRLYINGSLFSETATFVFNDAPNRLLFVNYAAVWGGNGPGLTIPFYTNDVRVYDHCLSKHEVKDIAKGLMLHYPLDDAYIEPTINLITSENYFSGCYNGATSKYGFGENTDIYKTTGVFQGKHCTKVYMGTNGLSAYPYVYISNSFVSNGTNAPANKTISFDYFGTIGTTIIPYKLGSGTAICNWTNDAGTQLHGSATNRAPITVVPGTWNHITMTFSGTTDANAEWGYIQLGSGAHTSNTSNYWLFANMQIELNNHETPYCGVNGFNPKNEIPFELTSANYTQSNYSNRTTSSISNGVYHVNGPETSSDTSFSARSNSFVTLEPNTDYCLRFYCKSKSEGALSFGTSGQAYTGLIDSANNYYRPSVQVNLNTSFHGWVTLKLHTGNDTQYKINLGFDGPNIYGAGSFIEFSYVHLYKPNNIYDASGYGYDGNIICALSSNDDSPRHGRSTICEDTGSYTVIQKENFSFPSTPFTIAFWSKPTISTTTDTSKIDIVFANCKYFTYTNYPYFFYNGSGEYKYTNYWSDGKWHFVTGVYDGTTCNLYIDGNDIAGSNSTTSSYGVTAVNDLKISFKGNSLSDFRIYATALSEKDIKELYYGSAFIDKSGNLSCFNTEEAGSEPKVKKTGKVSVANFVEHGNYLKVLDDGSLWVRILHHNNPASNLFTQANCWWYDDGLNLYSALGVLKSSGWQNENEEYEFLACEKLTSSGTEAQYRWKQTSNPATSSTCTGYELISGNPGRNIGLMNKGTYGAMHNGNSYWCCCGSWTAYNSGTPGFGGVVTSGWMDLYVRIPDIKKMKGLQGNLTAFYKDSILSNQYIEI